MQQTAGPPLWFVFAYALIVVAAFATGFFVARLPGLPEPQRTALFQVHREILRSHVDEQDPAQLLDAAIDGMVHSCDPYGDYVAPSEVAHFVEETTGNYEGIGMVPLFDAQRMFVRFPLAGGPAERAGLAPGDEIVAVGDLRIADVLAAERGTLIEERIRGSAGTTVVLTVRPAAGGGDRNVAIERAPVHKPAIRWAQRFDDGLGYLYLADFHPGSADELRAALRELEAGDEPLRGLIVDLRWNGGGNLDECLAITRTFQPSGTILTVRRRGDEVVQRYEAEPSACTHPDLPLVLLVNHRSASASEVLAGALQDHGRARLVGTRTYGKGMINTVTTFKAGFRLKLTTGRFYTPNGRCIEGHHLPRHAGTNGGSGTNGGTNGGAVGGIAPDREVALPDDPALLAQVQTALENNEPPAQHRAAARAFAERMGVRAAGIVPPEQDPQLAAALATLRELATAAGSAK